MKRNFTVYFEIFGKKMKTTVLAESKTAAEQQVKDQIIFHKTVEKKDDSFNETMNIFEKIKDILK